MALTPQQTDFLRKAYSAAIEAHHTFPGAAAAEAAAESSWGASQSVQHNNLLGIKPPSWWSGDTFTLPTKEYIKGQWTTVQSPWAAFPSWADCFRCQMQILHRNKVYADALAATNPLEYIRLESAHWATGPERGQLVASIYRNHLDILGVSDAT